MYTPNDNTLSALQGNHRMSLSAVCIKQSVSGTITQSTIPISTGSVDARLNQQIARTAEFVVPRSFIDDGWLNPLTDRIILRTGVVNVGDVPIFTGRALSFDANETGKVQVSCVDIADDIVNDDFSTPWVNQSGDAYVNEFKKIVADVNTSYGVVPINVPGTLQPPLAWEINRGQALDNIASSINCIWMADRTGSITLFANPYAQSSPLPVFTIRDGVGGALVTIDRTLSRAKIFNSITLIIEQSTAPPISVVAQDQRPSSLTKYGDATPFGKRNKTYKVNTAVSVSVSDAVSLAQRLLSQSLALSETWQITLPHLPIFDPGDVIAVWYRNVPYIQVVEAVRYNLLAAQPTQLVTRTLVYSNIATIVGTSGA